MFMAATAPATAASVAAPSAIPFSQPRQDGYAQGTAGFVITAILLAIAVAVLWVARRKGWGGVAGRKVEVGGDGHLALTQRLRLSPTCTAFVLGDGERRVLIVESRHAVQISRLDRDATPSAQSLADAASASDTRRT